MVVARLRLQVVRRRGAPDFHFVGKFSTTQARCEPLTAARVASLCELFSCCVHNNRGGYV